MKICLLVYEFFYFENYKNISEPLFIRIQNSSKLKLAFYNFIIKKLIPMDPITFSVNVKKTHRRKLTFFYEYIAEYG